MITPDFPLTAPYRIDQFTVAPLAMASVFLVQVLLALLIQLAGLAPPGTERRRLWWPAVTALLLSTLVVFTLASWGTSDTTRFSHYLEWDPDRAPPELLWRLLRPVILLLPYRMAALHGLVATGYAAAPILLARVWGAPAWGGWWALVITCSPMLRGFLQNAHSRQALAVLLLLPLFLQAARLLRLQRRWLGAGVVVSALAHNTFVLNLPLSLTPWLLRRPGQLSRLGRGLPRRLAGWRWQEWRQVGRRYWPQLLAAAVVLVLFLTVAPIALGRLLDYAHDDYFNRYPLRRSVGRLQWALAIGLVLACLQRRLDPRLLLRCPLTQLLLLFGLLYICIQQSIAHLWLPQITSRLADGVAFFLLILYLAWLDRYRAHWCLFPVLYVTLQYWLEVRLLSSGQLRCGLNDDFLCLPDRWPWQVRY